MSAELMYPENVSKNPALKAGTLPNTEYEQAIIRVKLTFGIYFYIASMTSLDGYTAHEISTLIYALPWLFAALVGLFIIRRYPGRYLSRRMLAITLDISAITFYMYRGEICVRYSSHCTYG